MRIAYLTTDEVNSDLAQCWANTYDCEVIPLSPNDPPPEREFDAAIYDLEFLTRPVGAKFWTYQKRLDSRNQCIGIYIACKTMAVFFGNRRCVPRPQGVVLSID